MSPRESTDWATRQAAHNATRGATNRAIIQNTRWDTIDTFQDTAEGTTRGTLYQTILQASDRETHLATRRATIDSVNEALT